MKKKQNLREREFKAHLVIPVQGIKDQGFFSADELEVKQTEEPGILGEDKARCVSVDTKTAPVGCKKKKGVKLKFQINGLILIQFPIQQKHIFTQLKKCTKNLMVRMSPDIGVFVFDGSKSQFYPKVSRSIFF